jgi:CRP-like cAMP-binding protein
MEDLIPENTPTQHIAKGSVLQHAGQLASRAYYVRRGLLRSYILDEKGKEHIFMFASEGWLISDIDSQVFGKSSQLYIDALEPSEIIVLDNEILNRTFEAGGKTTQELFLPLFRRIAVMQQRILLLMSASARSRYETFLEIYPELPHRVPQKMIASYLGITPEALSTIRRQMVQKNS